MGWCRILKKHFKQWQVQTKPQFEECDDESTFNVNLIRHFSSALDSRDLCDNSDRYVNAFTKYINFTQSPNYLKNLSKWLSKSEKSPQLWQKYTTAETKNKKPQVHINPFPHNDTFWGPWETSLLKTLWEKEKLLVTSNFSFSHCVFYPFG